MYSHDSRQFIFSEFLLPFEGKLESKNLGVQLAAMVPWQRFEKQYAEEKTTVSVEDVINKLGSRVPDYTTSQKNFRILTLVLTDDNLTNEEWSYFSDQAQSFQDKFSWATGNRATATLGELYSIVK